MLAVLNLVGNLSYRIIHKWQAADVAQRYTIGRKGRSCFGPLAEVLQSSLGAGWSGVQIAPAPAIKQKHFDASQVRHVRTDCIDSFALRRRADLRVVFRLNGDVRRPRLSSA